LVHPFALRRTVANWAATDQLSCNKYQKTDRRPFVHRSAGWPDKRANGQTGCLLNGYSAAAETILKAAPACAIDRHPSRSHDFPRLVPNISIPTLPWRSFPLSGRQCSVSPVQQSKRIGQPVSQSSSQKPVMWRVPAGVPPKRPASSGLAQDGCGWMRMEEDQ
jgi:hypothetical protein